jgi:hypothetical protein
MNNNFPVEQIVELRAGPGAGETTASRGSGYLISETLVITAKHVVFTAAGSPRPEIFVQDIYEVGWNEGTIVWPTHGSDLDIAVIQLSNANTTIRLRQKTRFGRFTGTESVRCQALGFPRFLRDLSGRRDIDHLTGQVNVVGRLRSGKFNLDLDASPSHWAGGRSAWAGLSGAAVFARGLLVGICIEDNPNFGGARLTAMRLDEVASDPEFVRLLDGNGHIYLESVELSTVLQRPAMLAMSPAQLLTAERAVVRFRGRESVLDDLYEWCRDDGLTTGAGVLSSRLITGPGGQGKSRLAYELVRRMQGIGWAAGAVDPTADTELLAPLGNLNVPALLIVDYAEGRSEQVINLLRIAAQGSSRSPVRLLMLARSGMEANWWNDRFLVAGEQSLEKAEIVPLTTLESHNAGRLDAFTEAIEDFSIALRAIYPAANWEEISHTIRRPDLPDARFSTVLSLHLSALVLLLQSGPEPVDESSRTAPEDVLLRHEQRYWAKTISSWVSPLQDETLRRVVMAATLCGASTRSEAVATVSRVPGLRHDTSEDTRIGVARWLQALYPSPWRERFWGTLQPDLIAEHLFRDIVAEDSGDGVPYEQRFFSLMLEGASQDQLSLALDLAGRAAIAGDAICEELALLILRDPAGMAQAVVRAITRSVQPSALLSVLRTSASTMPVDQCRTILDLIPEDAAVLADLAIELAQHDVTKLRDEAAINPEAKRELFYAVKTLASRLQAKGRNREAFLVINNALELLQDLVDLKSIFVEPEHAHSRRLSIMDRVDLLMQMDIIAGRIGALVENRVTFAHAPVELLQIIVDACLETDHPEYANVFLPKLALSLMNLATTLSAVERYSASYDAANRAASIYRRLAASDAEYLPMLASMLTLLHLAQSEIGQPDASLKSEAVSIFRKLAVADNDVPMEQKIRSLSMLTNLMDGDEALSSTISLVQLYRDLAATAPGTYFAELGKWLVKLARAYLAADGTSEALSAIAEAHALYSRFRSWADPHALVEVLEVATSCFTKSDRKEEALEKAEAVVKIRRVMAGESADTSPNLAAALDVLANCLDDLGRSTDALGAAAEATAIYRRLTDTDPGKYLPRRASTLKAYVSRLTRLGHADLLLDAATEVTAVYRSLAEGHPKRYLPALAWATRTLAETLSLARRSGEAVPVAREAVVLSHRLADSDPINGFPALAEAICTLTRVMQSSGQKDGILSLSQEATRIHRQLVDKDPDIWRPELAKSLLFFGGELQNAGRREEAHLVALEAIELLAGLAGHDPNRFTRQLELAHQLFAVSKPNTGSGRRWPSRRRQKGSTTPPSRWEIVDSPQVGDTNKALADISLDEIRLSEVSVAALQLAISEKENHTILDTKAVFSAIARTHSYIDWYRIVSLARDPATLPNATVSDPMGHIGETWKGAPLTGSLARALRAAQFVLPSISEGLDVIPLGVLAVSLVSSPDDSASVALIQGFGLSHGELIVLVEEAVGYDGLAQQITDLQPTFSVLQKPEQQLHQLSANPGIESAPLKPHKSDTQKSGSFGKFIQSITNSIVPHNADLPPLSKHQKFLDDMVKEKFGSLLRDPKLRAAARKAADDKLAEYLMTHLIELLSDSDVDEFEQVLDEFEREDFRTFFESKISNYQEVISGLLIQFRLEYLNSDP